MQLPLKKSPPSFPATLTLKIEILSSPPFLKIWSGSSTPSPSKKKGGGARGMVHTMLLMEEYRKVISFVYFLFHKQRLCQHFELVRICRTPHVLIKSPSNRHLIHSPYNLELISRQYSISIPLENFF